jgi:hypothetical protein
VEGSGWLVRRDFEELVCGLDLHIYLTGDDDGM